MVYSAAVNPKITSLIRDIPDFPKPGILFKDITPALRDPEAFKLLIDDLAEPWRTSRVDAVMGVESRGFILGAPLAVALGAGFVPARKRGKLPWHVHQAHYDLEYGTDCIEVHRDALRPGERVLIVDDVIATGGTAAAAVKLAEMLQAEVVGFGALVEITALNGRARIPAGVDVRSLMTV